MLVYKGGAFVSEILRIVAVVASALFLMGVVRLVIRGRLLLKYSLLWMLLAVLVFLCGLFPQIVYEVARLLGFVSPSNLALLAGVVMLLVIALSLSVAVSRLVVANKNLTQRVAILEHEIERADARGVTAPEV